MNKKRKVIITAPSLDPTQNVSGVSSVVQFIIDNNPKCDYIHFELGKKDKEKRGFGNVKRLLRSYREWTRIIDEIAGKQTKSHNECEENVIVHYSFPLNAPSIIRDPLFMHYVLKRGMKMVVHIHGGLFLTAPKIPLFLKRILSWVFSWDVPFCCTQRFRKRRTAKEI